MAQDLPPKRTWQDVAEELSREQDSKKLTALAQELNRLFIEEERQKILQRLGRNPAGSK